MTPSEAGECGACGLAFNGIPEGWQSPAMRHALHIIDSKDARLAEAEALIRDQASLIDYSLKVGLPGWAGRKVDEIASLKARAEALLRGK